MSVEDNEIKHVIRLDENIREDEPLEDDELFTEEVSRPEKVTEEDEETPVPLRPAPKRIKKGLKRHIAVLLVSIAILGTLVFAVIKGRDLSYREPVRIYEDLLNREEYDGEEASYAYANGLLKSELKNLRSVLSKSPAYMTSLEESRIKSRIAHMEGARYRIDIDRAQALGEGDLMLLTDELSLLMTDLSASSYARGGDRELSDAILAITEELKDKKITDGYRLYCTVRTVYPENDGPASAAENTEFTVVKLDGHWIMWDKIYDIFRMNF
ncbi:MAG: hypothetical protein K5857_01180 [Lachnospiraceae bacterium]|nr:hypothetical protein [Lachnospiraceae bacterium]